MGTVLNHGTQEPIPGVTISVVGKNRGVITDIEGHFELSLDKGEKIKLSYLGYKDKTFIFKEDTVVNIFMIPVDIALEEAVVTSKKNINDIDTRQATGAIVSLEAEKISFRPTPNFIESLQGQVAGLRIKADGELGKPLQIRIRGNSTLPIKSKESVEEDAYTLGNTLNQPLFVLDGVIITAEAFSTLNINDIKTIKVLKDATASSLYGVKASNGVVEITSKRGINGATQYVFSMQQGLTLRGTPAVNTMETDEKLEFERFSENPETPGYKYSEKYIRKKNHKASNIDELISKGKKNLDSLKKINVNWFKELTRISLYQSYNLSMQGGDLKNKFYVSGNFISQDGKIQGNDIQRLTARFNYEHQLSSKIYIMFNSGAGLSNHNSPNSSGYSPTDLVYSLNPYEQKDKGILISYTGKKFNQLMNQFSRNNDDTRFNFSGNINIDITRNLHLSSVVGIDYLITESLSIVPPSSYSEIRDIPEAYKYTRGTAIKSKRMYTNYTTNTRMNYDKKMGRHVISLSANTDYYKNKDNLVGIKGHGLPSKLLSGAGINNGLKRRRRAQTSSHNLANAVLGIGVSALYTWNNKVEFYAAYKKDASSLLPKDKRWNSFWSAGIGYTVKKTDLRFGDDDLLNTLKLRFSFGKTASLAGITPSLAVPTFSYETNTYRGLRGFSLVDLFNEDLRPEENTSMNFGIDLHFLKTINLTTEFYRRRTEQMLLTVPIPPSNGFLQQLRNVGVMDNEGVEMNLNITMIKTPVFHWNLSYNLSYNRNVVINLYEGNTLSLSGNPYPDYEEGKPFDLIYALENGGIDPSDGTPRFIRKGGNEK
ncbi:SusC/RagA family TonB-linked outer membrane protein, partial [Elysia marginata]